jgi:hypothetical protein
MMVEDMPREEGESDLRRDLFGRWENGVETPGRLPL